MWRFAIQVIILSILAASVSAQDMFDSPVVYAVGDSPRSIISDDFNGDGYNDLATANEGSGNVSVLLGNGDGTILSAVYWQ